MKNNIANQLRLLNNNENNVLKQKITNLLYIHSLRSKRTNFKAFLNLSVEYSKTNLKAHGHIFYLIPKNELPRMSDVAAFSK